MASKQAQRSRKSANSTSSSTTLSSKHFLETSIDGAQSSPAMSAAIGAELSPKEIRQGEEIAWYADGDTIVRNEQNPSITYAYDRVYGPTTTTHHVYEVAAQHIVNGAMEGITSTIFAYAVTSSGKTHTMHGDQRSSGIIPLAVKDAFTIIQETPCWEFLLRVSYIEIYNEVVNDLLNPAGQNLRIREDHQIVDEKSLIKKYQHEIRLLKEELERLKNGTVSVPQPKGIGGQDIVLLKQNLAYLPLKRPDLILEDGNIDLYIAHDGNSEFPDDTSREEKSRKNGFLNWIKIRTQGGQMCFKL